jgi:hypothetical protein
MRYTGGLTGGNWIASLLADTGAGILDGAYLVENFENLNPANTHIGKPYNLYSKIDTEVERYLGFERWWGGHFLLTAEEIRAITGELFVGNKLTAGRILAPDGTPIDLRRIKAPIVVVCSHGDNITPPQQALNWILDLYDDVEQIRANEQTIVYTVHDSVGHLGIFVSAKVALKEHAEFVDSLELIEALAPGLYEMVIEEVRSRTRARRPSTSSTMSGSRRARWTPSGPSTTGAKTSGPSPPWPRCRRSTTASTKHSWAHGSGRWRTSRWPRRCG